jgi:hypothetical protein
MERIRTYEEFKEWLENMYVLKEFCLSKKDKPIVIGELLRRYADILYAESKSRTDDDWLVERDVRRREMCAYLLALSDVGKITEYLRNRIFDIIYQIYFW